MLAKIFLICLFAATIEAGCIGTECPKIRNPLKDLAPYHNHDRPHEVNTTQIHVNFFIRDMGLVNIGHQSMEFQLTMRQRYNDPRLSLGINSTEVYSTLYGSEVVSKIWMPDTFFRQERASHVHSTFEPNTYARVRENGDVFVSSRVTITIYCPGLRNMDQAYSCPLEIASYGYKAADVVYLWDDEVNDVIQENDGLYPGADLAVSFVPDTNPCTVTTATGTYSCIKMDVNLAHQAGGNNNMNTPETHTTPPTTPHPHSTFPYSPSAPPQVG